MNNTDLKQISELLDNKLDEKLTPIQKTLSGHGKMLASHGKMLESHGKMLESHDTVLKSIGKTLESQGKTLESHGKMLKSLKKDQGVMLAMLDGEQMKQSRRLKRVEDHLGITP